MIGAESDLFRFSLRKPFEKRYGWLVWALIGIVLSIAANALLSILLYRLGIEAGHSDCPAGRECHAKIVGIGHRNSRFGCRDDLFGSIHFPITDVRRGGLGPFARRGNPNRPSRCNPECILDGLSWISANKSNEVDADLSGHYHQQPRLRRRPSNRERSALPDSRWVRPRSSLCVHHACQWCYSCVWSFMYVRSRNLATPMLMHSMWNSTVLALLFLLTAMGIDVKQLL